MCDLTEFSIRIPDGQTPQCEGLQARRWLGGCIALPLLSKAGRCAPIWHRNFNGYATVTASRSSASSWAEAAACVAMQTILAHLASDGGCLRFI